ncbi:MAG: hypothetical protein K2K74_10900 [Lachnospiraceae bacterium]|nr:hypothetical protein [Lachnospiraceae bacterium]
MELIKLLNQNNLKAAANNIFEMAAYVDAMKKKMDSVIQELASVKDQLHRMEARDAEKGLKQTVQRAVDKLEQGYHAVKEKISDVKSAIKQKAGEIAAAFRQKGKEALNKAAEFLGIKKKLQDIKQNVQNTITEVDKTIVKADTFGTGMREAGQKIANAFRALADKSEKEYGEKNCSKTGLVRKPFEAKRKLLSGILKLADAAIEKTEQLAADARQYQTDKAGQEKEKHTKTETAIPSPYTAESGYQYDVDAFEMSINNNAGTAMDYRKRTDKNLTTVKSR